MSEFQSIGVIGGGAWGTALAATAIDAGREVTLWAFEAETIREINHEHANHTYLPGIALDPRLTATDSLEAIAANDAILFVPPAQHARRIGTALAQYLRPKTPLIICAKGIEQASGLFMTDVLADVLPQARLAVLSGPSFAAEVARGLPAAVTLAAADPQLGKALATSIGHRALRPYWSSDMIGVQLGGSIKNVLAIASGIVAGKQLGSSAHAALTTRGFAEMVRLGEKLGARRETMMGLSGLGDLLLTASSMQSRNMSLGAALGRGEALEDILCGRKSVSEGVYTAAAVVSLAERNDVELPICTAVQNIVTGAVSVDAAIEALLTRPFRAEA